MLWVVHAVGNTRPKLESYKYEMPGEENVTQTTVHVFDMEAREMKHMDDGAWKDQRMGIYRDLRVRFDPDPSAIRFSKWFSDQQRAVLLPPQPGPPPLRRPAGRPRDRRGHRDPRGALQHLHRAPADLPPCERGPFLWWSERDGWAHLYRYGPDGTLRNRLTEGPWHVGGVSEVNDEGGYVLFRANNREEGEDPYYGHLYRVGLDGSGLTLLNPGDYDHQASANDDATYFVDNYSRVNSVPASALYDASGRKIMDLEEADFSALIDAGYEHPEPYTVKAGDGVTDLYGVMYKPYDFDPTKKYPIVAYVYPGPQTESVSKSFSLATHRAGARPVRLHRHHDREPGRPPQPLQVVPQLRLREPPRLRTRGQEGRDRAARRPARLHRRRPRGDLRALGGRLHVHRRHARLPRLLQGGGVVGREPQQRRLQLLVVREAPRRQGGEGHGGRGDRASSTRSTATRTSPRT